MNPTPNSLFSLPELDDEMAPNQKKKGTSKTSSDDNNSTPPANSTENSNLSTHDGNGNVIPADEGENDGIFLMVRCKNLGRNSDNEDSTEIAPSLEEPSQTGEDLRKQEKVSSDEEFEISTWSWRTEENNEKEDKNDNAQIQAEETGESSQIRKRSPTDYYDGYPSQTVNCHNGGLCESEPIHMTLEEVKSSLQRLYGREKNSSSTPCPVKPELPKKNGYTNNNGFRLRHRKNMNQGDSEEKQQRMRRQRKSFPSSLKQTLCGWFKRNGTAKRTPHSKSSEELSSRAEGSSSSGDECAGEELSTNLLSTPSQSIPSLSPFANRALPPLPLGRKRASIVNRGERDLENNNSEAQNERDSESDDGENQLDGEEAADFTSSIYKVKDYGWYWGPISGETAERLLANEPDGSFVVRDSSDEHYIFSLTFKLNGLVRHVRIEHDQGNFSFGTFTNFKSHTIVGFIENAVEHSRSGRYLFFLHRRPVLGPMRVQLLHPVSRFKQVQSLQHMCRFVILKAVRRDLITHLPLPRRLKDYLNTPQYYTEEIDANEVEGSDFMGGKTNGTGSRIVPAATPEQHLLHGDLSDVVR